GGAGPVPAAGAEGGEDDPAAADGAGEPGRPAVDGVADGLPGREDDPGELDGPLVLLGLGPLDADPGGLRVDLEGGQPDGIAQLEVQRVAQEGPEDVRLDQVEHDPDPPAALHPAAQPPQADRVLGDPPGGDDEVVDPVERLGHRRQAGAAVEHADGR